MSTPHQLAARLLEHASQHDEFSFSRDDCLQIQYGKDLREAARIVSISGAQHTTDQLRVLAADQRADEVTTDRDKLRRRLDIARSKLHVIEQQLGDKATDAMRALLAEALEACQ